jgi:transcriptional regulator with XRE-family HTH domain
MRNSDHKVLSSDASIYSTLASFYVMNPDCPCSMTDNRTLEAQIANQIAALRKERRLTLKKMASTVGLSEAYLSRLENHKAPITVDNLGKIAAALSVPLEEFFAPTSHEPSMIITRAGKGKAARFRGPNGFHATLLAGQKRRKVMEPILIEVDTAQAEIPLKSHSGQEFNLITKGSCLFLYAGERYTLNEGDSVYFDADVPHAVRPLEGITCQLLAVVGSDEFSMHGDMMVLLNEPPTE